MKKFGGRFYANGFLALAVLCASLDGVHASTGGAEVDYKLHPYVASMNVKTGFWNRVREIFFEDKAHRCMGVVISPTTMITAAHCIMDDDLTGTFMSPAIRMKMYSMFRNEVKVLVPSDAKRNQRVKGGGARGTMDFWLNRFDVAYLKAGSEAHATPVKYDPEFDPYQEISRFGANGMPVNFFGHDSGDGKIRMGKVNVISGDQCFTQLANFAQHEGSRLDENEDWKLRKLRRALGEDPKSLFCVFNRKSDPIIAEKGDSGSPLIIDHQGTPILAGIMSAKIDVEKVSDYNSIFYYSNIANNSAFLKTCANEGLSSRSKRATSTPDVCESGGPYIAYTEPVLVPVNSLLLD